MKTYTQDSVEQTLSHITTQIDKSVYDAIVRAAKIGTITRKFKTDWDIL